MSTPDPFATNDPMLSVVDEGSTEVTVFQEEESEFMDERELTGIIWQYIYNSQNESGDELSEKRQKSLNYYLRRQYGNEKRGYSKVVTSEVFETVEWALPTFIRSFMGGDRVVEFVPINQQDVSEAQMETDALHQIIFGEEESYENFEMWFRAGLIYPNSYLKVWLDEVPEFEDTDYQNITQEQIGMLAQTPNLEITYVEPAGSALIGPNVEMPLFNVGTRIVEYHGTIKCTALPPEEVLVFNRATSPVVDNVPFVAHYRTIARSELIEMGYDPDIVNSLPVSTALDLSDEVEDRREPQVENGSLTSSVNHEPMEEVDFYECYTNIDYDQDGIAEFRRIVIGGSDGNAYVFENEETDYQPIVGLTCYAVPYTHSGLSMGYTSEENQLVTSTVQRQFLDNLYRTNRPRTFAGNGVNVNQLNNFRPNGVVEMRDVSQVKSEVTPPIVQQIVAAFQYLQEQNETTTGVTRHSQGIDARTLADSSMTAYVNALGQASQRIEMLVRSWAEQSMKKVFQKAHYLMRTNQNVHEMVQMHGEWIPINPASWRRRSRMRALVGIGTGTAQEKIAGALSLLEVQQQNGQMTTPDRMFNTLNDLVRAMGKRSVNDYFLDPRSEEAQRRGQQAEEEQRQQQEMMNQMLLAQIEDIRSGKEIDMMKLANDMEKTLLKHTEEMTKLELEHDEDVPGSAV